MELKKENYNLELERLIIGKMITNCDTLLKNNMLEGIKKEMFAEETHQKTFEFLNERIVNGYAIDEVVVRGFFKNNEIEDYLRSFLHNACCNVCSEERFMEYIKELKNLYLKREIDTISKNKTLSAEQMSKKIQERTDELIKKTNDETIKNCINGLAQRLIDIENNIDKNHFLKTDFIDFDRAFGGLPKGQLSLLAGSPSMGKALKMNCKILTKNGWKLNKDIKIGDYIIGKSGKETKVLGIFPQGKTKNYKITFIDDRSTICCENHLWEIMSSRFKKIKRKILKTCEIFDLLKKTEFKQKLSIPYFTGDYGNDRNFIIHPYLLGVLLGDGELASCCRWIKADIEIKEKIEKLLSDDVKVTCQNSRGDMFAIVNKTRTGEKTKYAIELEKLGLIGKKSYEKFIPNIYFHSSKEQRMELLNGLLDTDGSVVNKSGSVEFSTSSKQLSKDFQQLAWSLGFRCRFKKEKSYLRGEQKRDRYRCILDGENYLDLFYLPRKKELLNKSKRIRRGLTIKSIDLVEESETQCLMVDAVDHLFVIEDYIVTHNSSLALQMAINTAKQGKNVLFFSQEMGETEINNKIIANFHKINSFRLTMNNLYPNEIKSMKESNKFDEIKTLTFDYSTSLNSLTVQSKINEYKKLYKQNLDLIIVDHLHIFEDYKKSLNRNEALGNMTLDLKNIAKNNNIAVLLLSQLSRKEKVGIKGHTSYIPNLIDIRESGNIEANCDLIMFIHRPEYYIERDIQGLSGEDLEKTKRVLERFKGQADILIKKNRNGKCDNVALKFYPEYSVFENIKDSDIVSNYKNSQKNNQLYRG